MTVHDKIGRQETVDKICGLVDSLQKDQNFCLSLNGAWGSGKTFVLRMIEEQLSKKQEYVIIKYDAWENTFYDDPLIAMLYCILDALENLASEDVPEPISTGQKKKKATEMAKKIGEAIVETAAENNKVVKFSKDAIGKVKSIIKSYKETSLATNAQTEDYISYSAFLKQTIKQLNEISSQEVYEGKQTKLIVLVDEIDRCLSDEQLKILERMHHLFDVKNCAVIVAMNQDCITKTVHAVYGIDGYEYLRKFFDFTFKVEMLTNNYIASLFEDFIEKFYKLTKESTNKYNEQLASVELAYQCLLYGNKRVLENIDNREITRYYQRLLNVCNDFGWDRLIPEYVFFIIVGLYIRKCVSPTFLNEKEIWDNQKKISAMDTKRNVSNSPARNEMTYFDYLVEYLGISGGSLPNGMGGQFIKYMRCSIPIFFLYFNEVVFYSISKQECRYNSMRQFQGQTPIYVEDCRKLRDLIILYGGEQERCEK